MEATRDPYKIEQIDIQRLKTEFITKIGSIAATQDVKEILTCNTLGFIQILNVDINNNTVEILQPQPGDLPTTNIVLGDIELRE